MQPVCCLRLVLWSPMALNVCLAWAISFVSPTPLGDALLIPCCIPLTMLTETRVVIAASPGHFLRSLALTGQHTAPIFYAPRVLTALLLENHAGTALPNIITESLPLARLVAEYQPFRCRYCSVLSPCKSILQRSPLCLVGFLVLTSLVMYGTADSF